MRSIVVFKTNNKYYHIVKRANKYFVIISDKDKLDIVKDYALNEIEFDNLTSAMMMFMDFIGIDVVKCNTTTKAIYSNESFFCMFHGKDDTEFRINTNSVACPDWTVINPPEKYLIKIATEKSVTYIKKLKNGVKVLTD